MNRIAAHRRRPCPRRAGLTLIEVAIAAFIAAIAVVAGITSITQSVKTQKAQQADPLTAYSLASEIHALALTLPRTGTGPAATAPSGVTVLANLNGADFSPPINARLVRRADLGAWRQQSTVRMVKLSDPTALATVADGQAVLHELIVTISEGAEVRGTYSWWLIP